jgi:hypothetical protein
MDLLRYVNIRHELRFSLSKADDTGGKGGVGMSTTVQDMYMV